ncbi:MAG: hypothetical protein ABJA98_19750 [Acidobacteriota bacterium]
MALPWLDVLDAAIGMANMALARRSKARTAAEAAHQAIAGGAPLSATGPIETHLAGVVVAALREVFERDSRRLDLEREQAEAERHRAERLLRLELLRQAGEREIGRLRLIAAVAVVSWLATLLVAARLIGAGIAARVIFGSGWAVLVAALACALVGLSRVARSLTQPDLGLDGRLEPGSAGAWAAGFVIAGLALIGAAVILA